MAYIKIFSGSIVEVLHAKQSLQAKGIVPVVKDNTQSASMAGFGAVMPNFQEVFVHSEEVEAAKNILLNL